MSLAKEQGPPPLPVNYILRSRTREFKIVGVLGAGGYGITYRALNQVAFTTRWGMLVPKNTELAIKECFMTKGVMQRLPNGYARLLNVDKGIQIRSMFLKEARALQDNQVRYQHSGETVDGAVPLLHVAYAGEGNPNVGNYAGDAIYYLVMPFISGGTLQSCAGRRGIGEIYGWLVKLLATLSRLHRDNVLHRDIKPGNIMLQGNTPILIDFGISTSMDGENKAGGYTPDFAAPEQMRRMASVTTPLSDLFALGGTMYCLIAGEKPVSAIRRANGEPYKPLAERSELYKKMKGVMSPQHAQKFLASIDRALMMEPSERWPSADAWLRELIGIELLKTRTGGEVTKGASPSMFAQVSEWFRKSTTTDVVLVITITFLAVVILILAVSLLLS